MVAFCFQAQDNMYVYFMPKSKKMPVMDFNI